VKYHVEKVRKSIEPLADSSRAAAIAMKAVDHDRTCNQAVFAKEIVTAKKQLHATWIGRAR
jgi:hypothetical protein